MNDGIKLLAFPKHFKLFLVRFFRLWRSSSNLRAVKSFLIYFGANAPLSN